MERFFCIRERGSTVKTEILSGLTTFLAMAYILSVNPNMLKDTGMNIQGVFTATCVASGVATLVMAFVANLPVALAPGMGLNAFFTYTVVLQMGYSWQLALTAVLLEGILFIILSVFKVRQALMNAIPGNLKKAVAVGIGLFICLIGLSNASIAVNNAGTIISFSLIKGTALVALLGLILTIVLLVLNVPGAIIIGIVATTLIGLPFGVTVIPKDFSPVSTPGVPLFCKFDFRGILSLKFFSVFFTFLFVDMFDTIGTLLGVAEQANLKDEKGDIKNVNKALLSDAIGTVVGAMFGTSTVTSYVESSAGVAQGGKTGFSSFVTGMLFFLALFFSPLFLIVPSAATAPALIVVGYMMMKNVSSIDFKDMTEGIPCFITIMAMPFAYSIATGISWGIISYVITKVAARKAKQISFVTWVLFVIFLAKIIMDAL